MSDNLYKQYYAQKSAAVNQRGIDFYLTYEQWITWWGDDIVHRGKGKDKLCMCRYNDIGPYALWNIYKDTGSNNVRDAQRGRPSSKKGKPRSEETKRKIAEANLGKTFSEEHKRKLREARKGLTYSEERKRKMSEARKGIPRSEETIRKMLKPCSIEGVVYPSVILAAEAYSVHRSTIGNWIKSDQRQHCYFVH
tara:strand:- start:256 stop:837 length:582 start_codon:yes stop_codon:yes gene_type:complete